MGFLTVFTGAPVEVVEEKAMSLEKGGSLQRVGLTVPGSPVTITTFTLPRAGVWLGTSL